MISIVIPSYNQQEYLADAIESALHQTLSLKEGYYEIVIVDDGSTDNSYDIAWKYFNDNKNKISLYRQTNRGLASARNTGIMNARGNWILPLDADDILIPNAIERIEQEIAKYAKSKEKMPDVIGLSCKTFGTSNQEIILMPEPKLADFRSGNRLGYCSAINKIVLESVGGYNPKMVEGYEDLYLWIDLLNRGNRIVTIPEQLWLYRTKDKSMWKDISPEIHQKLIGQINKDFPEAQLNF